MGFFAQRRSADPDDGHLVGYPAMGEDAAAYPNLVEFLSLVKCEDGRSRVTGTVTVMVEGGRLKVCMNDRDADLVAFRCVDTLDTLLGVLEGALVDQETDWRRNKNSHRSARK